MNDLPLEQGRGPVIGWIAFYKHDTLVIPKDDDCASLYRAKQIAIAKLGVPKSKQSLVAVEPAYYGEQIT